LRLRVHIERQRLLAIVRLYDGERPVALTTMDRDTQASDAKVRRFIARYHRHPWKEDTDQ